MAKQLECRIIITWGHREDLKTEIGMYCKNTNRYEPLGAHGPRREEIDRVVLDLKKKIEMEGHRCTFSERRGPR